MTKQNPSDNGKTTNKDSATVAEDNEEVENEFDNNSEEELHDDYVPPDKGKAAENPPKKSEPKKETYTHGKFASRRAAILGIKDIEEIEPDKLEEILYLAERERDAELRGEAKARAKEPEKKEEEKPEEVVLDWGEFPEMDDVDKDGNRTKRKATEQDVWGPFVNVLKSQQKQINELKKAASNQTKVEEAKAQEDADAKIDAVFDKIGIGNGRLKDLDKGTQRKRAAVVQQLFSLSPEEKKQYKSMEAAAKEIAIELGFIEKEEPKPKPKTPAEKMKNGQGKTAKPNSRKGDVKGGDDKKRAENALGELMASWDTDEDEDDDPDSEY